MLKITTLALMALLSIGVASIGATSTATAAAAMSTCPPSNPNCGGPPPPGGGGPGPDGDPDPWEPPPPPPPGGKVDVRYSLALDCDVDDEAPVTDDFFIINVGSEELPAGLKIRYEIPSTGERGAFLLPRSLAAGQKAKIADLLEQVDAGTECRAMVIT